jgi:nicotinate-nucleotide adenylyltransferase
MKTPIGILGGTFDPIHNGHIHLANIVREQCMLDYVMFVPCMQAPLKAKPTANINDRLAMLKLAITTERNLLVNTSEIDSFSQDTPNYTLHTLQHLREQFADTPLCWIMGIDAFNDFTQWYKWQEIPTYAHLIIANRPHNSLTQTAQEIKNLLTHRQIFNVQKLSNQIAGDILLMNINPLPIAANTLRSAIHNHQDVKKFLHPAVWEYIKNHKLYCNYSPR